MEPPSISFPNNTAEDMATLPRSSAETRTVSVDAPASIPGADQSAEETSTARSGGLTPLETDNSPQRSLPGFAAGSNVNIAALAEHAATPPPARDMSSSQPRGSVPSPGSRVRHSMDAFSALDQSEYGDRNTHFSDDEDDDDALNESMSQRDRRRALKISASGRTDLESQAIRQEAKRKLSMQSKSSTPSHAPLQKTSSGSKAAMQRYGARSAVHTAHVVVKGTAEDLADIGILPTDASGTRASNADVLGGDGTVDDIIGFGTGAAIVDDIAQSMGPPSRFHLYAGGKIPPEVIHIAMDTKRTDEDDKVLRRSLDQKLNAGAFRSTIWLAGRVEPALQAVTNILECSLPYPTKHGNKQDQSSSSLHASTYPYTPVLYQSTLLDAKQQAGAPLLMQPQCYPYILPTGEVITKHLHQNSSSTSASEPPPFRPFASSDAILNPEARLRATTAATSVEMMADPTAHPGAKGQIRYLPTQAVGLHHKRFVAASASWSQALLVTAGGDVYQWRLTSSDPLEDPDADDAGAESSAAVDGDSAAPSHSKASIPLSPADQADIALGPVLVQALCWERALRNVRILAVACGAQHCVALSAAPNFDVYTWGNGSDGRLGHGCDKDEPEPRIVSALMPYRVVSIAAGGAHTAAITMGLIDAHAAELCVSQVQESIAEAQSGDLGETRRDGKVGSSATVVEHASAVTGASLRVHEAAKSGDESLGAVWTWGRGANGRLGLGHMENVNIPQRVRHILRIRHRVVDAADKEGQNGGATSAAPGGTSHTEKGDASSPGTGVTTNLSDKPVKQSASRFRGSYFSRKPTDKAPVNPLFAAAQELEYIRTAIPPSARNQKPLKERAICTQVTCGRSFTAVVTADGDVWTWGKSSEGQTGISQKRLTDATEIATRIKGMKTKLPAGALQNIAVDENIIVPCRVEFPVHMYPRKRGNTRTCALTVYESLDPTLSVLSCPQSLEGSERAQRLRTQPPLFSVSETPKGDSSSRAGDAPLTARSNAEDGHSVATDSETVHAYSRNRREALDPIYWATGHKAAPGSTESDEDTLDLSPDSVRSVRIAAGHSHMVCCARDGTVWCWGLNNYGQVGSSGNVKSFSYPLQIACEPYLMARAEARVTNENESAVSAVVNIERRLNLADTGDGEMAAENCVTLHGVGFERDPVVAVYGGPFHTVVATAGGALLAWGRNHEGALGHMTEGAKADPDIVQVYKKVSMLAPKRHEDKEDPGPGATADNSRPASPTAATGSATPRPAPAATASGDGAGAAPVATSMLVGRPWRRILDIACGKDFTIFIEAPMPRQEHNRAFTLKASEIPRIARRSTSHGVPRTSLYGADALDSRSVSSGAVLPRGPRTSMQQQQQQLAHARNNRLSALIIKEKSSETASVMGQSVSASMPYSLSMLGRIPRAQFEADVQAKVQQLRNQLAERKAEEVKLAGLCNEWRRVIDTFTGDFRYALSIDPPLQKLWRQGVPPSMRGLLWLMAIGNQARVTPASFELARQRAMFIKRHSSRAQAARARRAESVAATPSASTITMASNAAPDVTPIKVPASLASSSSSSSSSRPLLHGKERTLDEIVTDLDRTFPALSLFGPEETVSEGPLGPILRDVLEAFVIYRPELGYVQGLSYIAAMLAVFIGGLSVRGTLRRPTPVDDGKYTVEIPTLGPPTAPLSNPARYSSALAVVPASSKAAAEKHQYIPPGAVNIQLSTTATAADGSSVKANNVLVRAFNALRPLIRPFNASGPLFRRRASMEAVTEVPLSAETAVTSPKPAAVDTSKASRAPRESTSLLSSLFSTIGISSAGGSSAPAATPSTSAAQSRKLLHRKFTGLERSTPAALVADDKFLVFQALCNVMQQHHLYIFYSLDGNVMSAFYNLFDRCLSRHNPAMLAHLQDCGITGEYYLFPWFQTVFLKTLPLKTAAYVWDLFLADGMTALYRTALALLDLLTPFILTDVPSFEDTMQIFSRNAAAKRAVWDQISGLQSVQAAIEAVVLPGDVAIELQDLLTDPFFYRYVGGGRDVLPYNTALLATRFNEDVEPRSRARSRAVSWASMPAAVGQGKTVTPYDDTAREELMPVMSDVVTQLEKVF